MQLNDLVTGQMFWLEEFSGLYSYIAVENAHIEKELNGEEYWVVHAANMISEIVIPLKVHKNYPHYLKVRPYSEAILPCIGLEWTHDECSRCS